MDINSNGTIVQTHSPFSLNYIYYYSRYLTGYYDDGHSTLLASMRVLKAKGICKTELWSTDNSILSGQEIEIADIDASHRRFDFFQTLDSVNQIKESLNFGPISITLHVFTSIYDVDESGIVPHPQPKDYYIAQHAVNIISYNDNMVYIQKNGIKIRGFFYFSNSWGSEWGDHGYGYVSYEYVRQYSVEIISGGFGINKRLLQTVWEKTDHNELVLIKTWMIKGNIPNYEILFVYDLMNSRRQLMGWVICAKDNKHTVCRIVDLFVWPDFRAKGYGDCLLRVMERYEKTQGVTLVFGWISSDDTNDDGSPFAIEFLRKKRYEFVFNEDIYPWAKGVMYRSIMNPMTFSATKRLT